MKINIKYPITDSQENEYVQLTTTKKEAIKSNLLFFLTTKKGQRYYNPDFGTNLEIYLFEPFTDTIQQNIETTIRESVLKYFNNISIDNIVFNTNNNHILSLKIDFSYNEDIFKYSDSIVIQNS